MSDGKPKKKKKAHLVTKGGQVEALDIRKGFYRWAAEISEADTEGGSIEWERLYRRLKESTEWQTVALMYMQADLCDHCQGVFADIVQGKRRVTREQFMAYRNKKEEERERKRKAQKKGWSQMDPKTGKIRLFGTKEDAEKAGYTIPLQREPKKNCKKCFGRGHIGRDPRKNKYVPCRCTQ